MIPFVRFVNFPVYFLIFLWKQALCNLRVPWVVVLKEKENSYLGEESFPFMSGSVIIWRRRISSFGYVMDVFIIFPPYNAVHILLQVILSHELLAINISI